MQRKRNIQLLVLLTVMSVITVFVFIALGDGGDEIVDKNIFRVADLTMIDQVSLTQDGKTLDLKFEGTRWKVNGQLADKRMIDVLFATLQQAEPKRPVAESIQDSIGQVLDQQGVKVRLFEKSELQLEFQAGGNTAKTQAYFKLPASDESYVVVIPGYRVYAAGILEMKENGWRDKYVFNFNWQNFQTLDASFINPKEDFEIAMGDAYFEIKGIQADTTRLNDFLDAVSLLTVDEYLDKTEVKGFDSLVQAQPIQKLVVKDVAGRTYSVAFYKSENEGQVLGIVQDELPALFDKRKLTAILRNRTWFKAK